MSFTAGITFVSGDQLTPDKLNTLVSSAVISDGYITEDMLDDGCVTEYKITDATVTSGKLSLEEIYPIGSVYINYIVSENPSTLIGIGTWRRIQDETVINKSVNYTAMMIGQSGGTYEAGSAYGSRLGEHVHYTSGVSGDTTLTRYQSGIPNHTHTMDIYSNPAGSSTRFGYNSGHGTTLQPITLRVPDINFSDFATSNGYAAQAHHHGYGNTYYSPEYSIPPVFGAYIWIRIS